MVAAAVPGEDVAIHVDDEDLTAQYPETSQGSQALVAHRNEHTIR